MEKLYGYFISGILTLGSEAIATDIFLKYWIPSFSSSIFALAALIIVIFINRLGTKYFGYIESVMSMAKIAVIIFFITLGFFFISRNGIILAQNPFASLTTFFPNGVSDFLQSMLMFILTIVN